MHYTVDKFIYPFLKSFIKIKIKDDYYAKLISLAAKITEKKLSEKEYSSDNSKTMKRFTTGLTGEAALEFLLGLKIIDWEVGNSSKFANPDIPGYNVGIKTVEGGKFPIIKKENHYPQIICIVSKNNPQIVYVCGLATPETLNTYQTDDLIIDPKLKEKGTKTGFYGFEFLQPIKNIESIEKWKQ